MGENHYYPFGMNMEGPWCPDATNTTKNHYQFNGIELFEDLDLNVNFAFYRSYDPAIGRWWQVDPKAESFYGMTVYNGMGNNPVSVVDPQGDIGFVPIAIGAVLGGLSGHSIGKAKGLSGFGLLGHSLLGAAIGGLSTLAGSGVSTALGKSLTVTSVGTQAGAIAIAAGGATGGIIGGGGFAALSGQNVLNGALKGAVASVAGSLIGARISGGLGAFLGGVTSGGLSAALDGQNIAYSALIGGLTSFSSYTMMNEIRYKNFGSTLLSRKQFNAMTRATQKSFITGKEYGAWLLKGGGIEWWEVASTGNDHIDPGPKPTNAWGEFHTHPNLGGGYSEIHSHDQDVPSSRHDKTFSYVISRTKVFSFDGRYEYATRPGTLKYTNKFFTPYPYNSFGYR
ncbi:MAG: RHS repeat-associated core domain-containing protein [Chitinophagales bacterium]